MDLITANKGRVFYVAFALGLSAMCIAQNANPPQKYPSQLPYSFGNFVWWNDEELRALLKERIPGLGDELVPDSPIVGKVRDGLTALLREKGITADVLSQEPSYSSYSGARDPDAPAPSIQFSMLHPAVLVDQIVIAPMSDEITSVDSSVASQETGKPYSAFGDWYLRSQIKQTLHQKGYLDAQAQISQLAPRKEGDHYVVSLSVAVDPGPQYHVSSVTAGGGPLLAGRDLSSLIELKPGDLPGRFPLSHLTGQLRDFYLHYGYADVVVENIPVLDRKHALVSYHVDVIPGPVYHIHNISVEKLNAVQESRVREILGLKIGDAYSEEAISSLYRKLSAEPLLTGLRFGYGVKKDAVTDAIDLTLSFFKEGGGSNFTVK